VGTGNTIIEHEIYASYERNGLLGTRTPVPNGCKRFCHPVLGRGEVFFGCGRAFIKVLLRVLIVESKSRG